MGMSASQARLLTLTARLSDLEYKAQSISNSKLRLAVQSEGVSKTYSDELNKQRLSVMTGTNNSTATYSDLSYASLCGPDGDTLSQYGLSTTSGALLVSKDMDNKFKSSYDLQDFLVANGQSQLVGTLNRGAYEAAKTTVASAKAAYLGTDGTGTVNGAHADTIAAKNALDQYGTTHVQGYSTEGNWAYVKSEPVNVFKAYNDADVFNVLSDPNYNFQYAAGTSGSMSYTSDSNNQQVLLVKDTGSTHIDSTDPGDNATVCGWLATMCDDVSSDVTVAVKALLMSNLDNPPANLESVLDAAAQQAKAQTAAKYVNDFSNHNWGASGSESVARNYANTHNQVGIDSTGDDAIYIDTAEMVKTFLDYFDQARGASTGTVGANTTTRSTYDSINTGANVPLGTVNMDITHSSDDADAANHLNYLTTGTETQSQVSTAYKALLGTYNAKLAAEATAKKTYDNAVSALQLVTPQYTNDGDNVGYYTNLYNRMNDENGYKTVGPADENNTLNNADWIQNQIINGNLLLEKVDSDNNWQKISWKADSNITDSTDNTDIARAEANYSFATAEIQSKDKKFDLELQNIESEHTAVQTEVDSVKKVIDKNIERTFKNFNA